MMTEGAEVATMMPKADTTMLKAGMMMPKAPRTTMLKGATIIPSRKFPMFKVILRARALIHKTRAPKTLALKVPVLKVPALRAHARKLHPKDSTLKTMLRRPRLVSTLKKFLPLFIQGRSTPCHLSEKYFRPWKNKPNGHQVL
jgi:hypothetical protein